MRTPLPRHPIQRSIEREDVRSGLPGGNVLLAEDILHRGKQPAAIPHRTEHLIQQRRRRRLSVGPRHAHQGDTRSRVVVKRPGHQRQGPRSILDLHVGHPGVQLPGRLAQHHRASPCTDRLVDIVVPVGRRALYGDKGTGRHHRPRIERKPGQRQVFPPAEQTVRDPGEHFL